MRVESVSKAVAAEAGVKAQTGLNCFANKCSLSAHALMVDGVATIVAVAAAVKVQACFV